MFLPHATLHARRLPNPFNASPLHALSSAAHLHTQIPPVSDPQKPPKGPPPSIDPDPLPDDPIDDSREAPEGDPPDRQPPLHTSATRRSMAMTAQRQRPPHTTADHIHASREPKPGFSRSL
ncbi:hypothetical protein [Paraburkholderia sp. ZP32-5]|uniref:hypothetical protein n=1 Tax=Paraburkholderia sp. ZP32-5 TaxID=2883245 RepID=UPI001F21A5DA|nr:hypothetical protein [Paraburkholderia sp. ZP32-5]